MIKSPAVSLEDLLHDLRLMAAEAVCPWDGGLIEVAVEVIESQKAEIERLHRDVREVGRHGW